MTENIARAVRYFAFTSDPLGRSARIAKGGEDVRRQLGVINSAVEDPEVQYVVSGGAEGETPPRVQRLLSCRCPAMQDSCQVPGTSMAPPFTPNLTVAIAHVQAYRYIQARYRVSRPHAARRVENIKGRLCRQAYTPEFIED